MRPAFGFAPRVTGFGLEDIGVRQAELAVKLLKARTAQHGDPHRDFGRQRLPQPRFHHLGINVAVPLLFQT